jgi:hypothetical protein
MNPDRSRPAYRLMRKRPILGSFLAAYLAAPFLYGFIFNRGGDGGVFVRLFDGVATMIGSFFCLGFLPWEFSKHPFANLWLPIVVLWVVFLVSEASFRFQRRRDNPDGYLDEEISKNRRRKRSEE